jgi:hypothetical protein
MTVTWPLSGSTPKATPFKVIKVHKGDIILKGTVQAAPFLYKDYMVYAIFGEYVCIGS